MWDVDVFAQKRLLTAPGLVGALEVARHMKTWPGAA